MDDSTGEQSRLSRLKTRDEMKLKETVSILPRKESPSVRFSKDGKLLAVTLLLALLSCCLTVLSFCRLASLQAELGRLRAELRELPGAPQAGAAAPRAALREAAAATSALKVSLRQPQPHAPAPRRPGNNGGLFSRQGSFALPAPGESNSSQSSRSKRGLQDAEETGMLGAQKRLGVRDPSSQVRSRGEPDRTWKLGHLPACRASRVWLQGKPSPGRCDRPTARFVLR